MHTYNPKLDAFSLSIRMYFAGSTSIDVVIDILNRISTQDLFAVSEDNQQTRLFYLITQCDYYGRDINNHIDLIEKILHRAATAHPFCSGQFKNGVQWMLHCKDIYDISAVSYIERFKRAAVLNKALESLPDFVHHVPANIDRTPYLNTEGFLLLLNNKSSKEFIQLLKGCKHSQCANFFHNLYILLHNRLVSIEKLHELFTVKNPAGYSLLEILMAPEQHPLNIYLALCFLFYAKTNGLMPVSTYMQALFFAYEPSHCLMHRFALQYPHHNVPNAVLGFDLYLRMIVDAQKSNLISKGQSLQLFLNENRIGRTASSQLFNSRDASIAYKYVNFLQHNPLKMSNVTLRMLLEGCTRSNTKELSDYVNNWLKNTRFLLTRRVCVSEVLSVHTPINYRNDFSEIRLPGSALSGNSIFSPEGANNPSCQQTQDNRGVMSRSNSVDDFLREELRKMSFSGL